MAVVADVASTKSPPTSRARTAHSGSQAKIDSAAVEGNGMEATTLTNSMKRNILPPFKTGAPRVRPDS